MEVNIDIKTKEKTLHFKPLEIKKLKLFSEYNLALPYLEATVSIKHFPDIKFLKERNLKVEISIKFKDTTKKYKFITTEQEINFNLKTASFSFFAFPVWYKEILKERIQSFNKGTSGKKIDSVNCIKNLFGSFLPDLKTNIDLKADDEQIWIQYGNKTIDFLREVIIHSHSEKTALTGFRKDDIFSLLDYDKQIKTKPVLTIKNISSIKNISLHLGNTIKDTFFSEGIQVKEFKLIDDKQTRIPSSQKVYINKEKLKNANNEKDFALDYKVNFGNTHPKFNSSPLTNQTKWYNLENNIFEIELEDFFFYDLFEVVSVKIPKKEGATIQFPIMNGEYIIIGVINIFENATNERKTILRITKRDI